MKKSICFLIISLAASSCYKQLSMEGFDKEKWLTYGEDCSEYRLNIAPHILENESILLEKTQNEVESLLGRAEEHELYNRNQKYFHYRLTPSDSCESYETLTFLSVRFNAIGRANLVQMMLRDVDQ